MMELSRLTDDRSELFARAMALYGNSFPVHEQRESASQRRCMVLPDYHFDLIWDEDRWAGEILYWETEDFLYVEHFCTVPEVRGQGCGRRALDCLFRKGKTVILEIDPPEDALSVRRKGFYERAGFAVNRFAHVHPPYHAGYAGHALVVLSWPQALTEQDYRRFDAYLRGRVMHHCFAADAVNGGK